VGGHAPRFNGFSIDGVDTTGWTLTGDTAGDSGSVAGIHAADNQFGAEYGILRAGSFNICDESGTNDWHGAGWCNTAIAI